MMTNSIFKTVLLILLVNFIFVECQKKTPQILSYEKLVSLDNVDFKSIQAESLFANIYYYKQNKTVFLNEKYNNDKPLLIEKEVNYNFKKLGIPSNKQIDTIKKGDYMKKIISSLYSAPRNDNNPSQRVFATLFNSKFEIDNIIIKTDDNKKVSSVIFNGNYQDPKLKYEEIKNEVIKLYGNDFKKSSLFANKLTWKKNDEEISLNYEDKIDKYVQFKIEYPEIEKSIRNNQRNGYLPITKNVTLKDIKKPKYEILLQRRGCKLSLKLNNKEYYQDIDNSTYIFRSDKTKKYTENDFKLYEGDLLATYTSRKDISSDFFTSENENQTISFNIKPLAESYYENDGSMINIKIRAYEEENPQKDVLLYDYEIDQLITSNKIEINESSIFTLK